MKQVLFRSLIHNSSSRARVDTALCRTFSVRMNSCWSRARAHIFLAKQVSRTNKQHFFQRQNLTNQPQNLIPSPFDTFQDKDLYFCTLILNSTNESLVLWTVWFLHCDPAGCRESFCVFTFTTCFMTQPAGRYTYCRSKARNSWNIFQKISPYNLLGHAVYCSIYEMPTEYNCVHMLHVLI